jgi:hypothetical protein
MFGESIRHFESAMKKDADFFLSAAGEMRGDLATPRACWAKRRLRDDVRDDYMLIEIEPPLLGQNYGLGSENITELIISTRLQGFSLFPIYHLPCEVYVARILDRKITLTMKFNGGQVELIGWATIFRTLDEAIADADLWKD